MSQNEIRESIEGSDLLLEYTFKINEGDGVKKVDATVKRGLLSITSEEQLDELGITKGPPAEVRFKYLAGFLRAALQKAGYPSDVEYVWISIAGGEWRYDQNHEDDLGEQPYELRSWHDQLVAMTKPLSRYRLIGDLLHMIDQLLRQNLNAESLNICWRLMKAYWKFQVSIGAVNRWANRGMTSEKCLAKGPETRKARGTVVLEVVCKHAEKLWFRKEILRGNKTNTAEEMFPT